jgi:hypothetical protein
VSEIHPFSDTDLSPIASPHLSRSASPIKSDTEYELSEHRAAERSGDDGTGPIAVPGPPGSQLQWNWGELPARQTPSAASALTASSAQGVLTALGEQTKVDEGVGNDNVDRSNWQVAQVRFPVFLVFKGWDRTKRDKFGLNPGQRVEKPKMDKLGRK